MTAFREPVRGCLERGAPARGPARSRWRLGGAGRPSELVADAHAEEPRVDVHARVDRVVDLDVRLDPDVLDVEIHEPAVVQEDVRPGLEGPAPAVVVVDLVDVLARVGIVEQRVVQAGTEIGADEVIGGDVPLQQEGRAVQFCAFGRP